MIHGLRDMKEVEAECLLIEGAEECETRPAWIGSVAGRRRVSGRFTTGVNGKNISAVDDKGE
jgi:hypothetical protein